MTRANAELILRCSHLLCFVCQGFCVSLLFCFCNAEVTAAIRKFCTHQLLRHPSDQRLGTRRHTIKSTVV